MTDLLPIVRFTIGNLNPLATKCLIKSIHQIKKMYEVEVYICFNGETPFHLNYLPVRFLNQHEYVGPLPFPVGVAWKLYPPRLDITRHEIFIDNDLVLNERIPELDLFLENDNYCLLLEEDTRTYGRFNKHVANNVFVNSGIFGIPPKFDFEKYVQTYANCEWEINAKGIYEESKTFDEQGLVALILSNQKYMLIPKTTITNCEKKWQRAKGNHFIGLNRNNLEPFRSYMVSQITLQ